MQINTALRIAALSALLFVAGCADSNGNRDGASAEKSVDTASTADSSSTASAADNLDSFEVTLAGPPYQGTHSESGQIDCMVHDGLWQAGWEAPEKTGLSGVMLQLKEVPVSGGSTDKMSFSAVFGSQADPDASMAIVDVTGSEYGRDGRGAVTRQGDGAVIRIEGTAQHGVQVTAVVRCASVDELM